jgi:peptide deformylase
MAVLEIREYPDPILLQDARPVAPEEIDDALRQKLSDMAETMYAAPGVGLAAPQVGDSRRFIVIDPGEKEERGRSLFKMINPVIAEFGPEPIYWNETCLSVPDLEVRVQRHKRIRVQWLDEHGKPQERWFEGYEAVIVQHELDHLQGTVLAERVSFFKRKRWLSKREKERKREALYA